MTTNKTEPTDGQRLDWLQVDEQRLQDVYWRMQNEHESVREAIDALTIRQARSAHE